jgi:hypothetical protein
MNHQNFALLARDFSDAFASHHVKRLRACLGFVFGNNPVYFRHVGSCWIVFEQRCIAIRRKGENADRARWVKNA